MESRLQAVTLQDAQRRGGSLIPDESDHAWNPAHLAAYGVLPGNRLKAGLQPGTPTGDSNRGFQHQLQRRQSSFQHAVSSIIPAFSVVSCGIVLPEGERFLTSVGGEEVVDTRPWPILPFFDVAVFDGIVVYVVYRGPKVAF